MFDEIHCDLLSFWSVERKLDKDARFYVGCLRYQLLTQTMQALPDDHSKLVPLLPIPNRTVKRLSANDSADSRVKVGHRQALYTKPQLLELGFFYGRDINKPPNIQNGWAALSQQAVFYQAVG